MAAPEQHIDLLAVHGRSGSTACRPARWERSSGTCSASSASSTRPAGDPATVFRLSPFAADRDAGAGIRAQPQRIVTSPPDSARRARTRRDRDARERHRPPGRCVAPATSLGRRRGDPATVRELGPDVAAPAELRLKALQALSVTLKRKRRQAARHRSGGAGCSTRAGHPALRRRGTGEASRTPGTRPRQRARGRRHAAEGAAAVARRRATRAFDRRLRGWNVSC